MRELNKDIMNHMLYWYRRITEEDTKMKKESLQEPLETSQLIYVLFGVIGDGVRYSSEANTPTALLKVLQM